MRALVERNAAAGKGKRSSLSAVVDLADSCWFHHMQRCSICSLPTCWSLSNLRRGAILQLNSVIMFRQGGLISGGLVLIFWGQKSHVDAMWSEATREFTALRSSLRLMESFVLENT